MQTFSPKNRLNVFTKAGVELGKVVSIDIDTNTGRVETFRVSSSHLIPRILDQELIVSWSQVIEWQEESIIVTDAVVPAKARNIALGSSKKAGAHLSSIE